MSTTSAFSLSFTLALLECDGWSDEILVSRNFLQIQKQYTRVLASNSADLISPGKAPRNMVRVGWRSLLFGAAFVSAFYDSGDNVAELTSSNFKSSVVDSDEIWLVEFYAPWCGHCKSLVPEWKKAAMVVSCPPKHILFLPVVILFQALGGIVRVKAVDVTEHQDVGSSYNVNGSDSRYHADFPCCIH